MPGPFVVHRVKEMEPSKVIIRLRDEVIHRPQQNLPLPTKSTLSYTTILMTSFLDILGHLYQTSGICWERYLRLASRLMNSSER